ncbi:MAG: hypothetical protein JXA25_02060 [Anaerolineales bacterium]|nr:hypothetical protein [Anaerolineales bacterium]
MNNFSAGAVLRKTTRILLLILLTVSIPSTALCAPRQSLIISTHRPAAARNISKMLSTGQTTRANASLVSGAITVTSSIKEGYGSYFEPYVVDSTEIKFNVQVSGADKENALYQVTVHMEHYRSCTVQKRWDNLTYQDLLNRNGEFTFDAPMAGWYYLRININEDGDFVEYKPARTHVYSRVPPVNSFSLPYIHPASNHSPAPELTILNSTGGSGTHGDPLVINGTAIRFRVDHTSDRDGSSDITNGVMFWAIQTDGHHPIYSGGQQISDPAATFLYNEDFTGAVYSWDTTENPSSDGQYSLHLCVIDQHGEKDEIRVAFTTGTPQPADPDLNQDGSINILDIQVCINIILGSETSSMLAQRADLNGDGSVDQSDLHQIVSSVLQF